METEELSEKIQLTIGKAADQVKASVDPEAAQLYSQSVLQLAYQKAPHGLLKPGDEVFDKINSAHARTLDQCRAATDAKKSMLWSQAGTNLTNAKAVLDGSKQGASVKK
jgi:hypothetical protein